VLPLKGKIGVLNGIFYENVLVTMMHPEYISGENMPNLVSLADLKDDFYHDKMERINDFVNHLVQNRTIVLNLSKDE
jgi:polyphosphate kinase 2 (PPK2 family)